jgi:hypothetical protein
MADEVYAASDDVIFSKVEGETILLHTKSDKAYGLDPTAAYLWDLMSGEGKTRDQLIDDLTDAYAVDRDRAGHDIDRVIDHLSRESLINS